MTREHPTEFPHGLGRDEAFAVAIKSPESGQPNLAAKPGPV
jgi:hypothetical protein